jgi:hypothetical protein
MAAAEAATPAAAAAVAAATVPGHLLRERLSGAAGVDSHEDGM